MERRWHRERPPRPCLRTRSAPLAVIERSRLRTLESRRHQSLFDPRIGDSPIGRCSVPGGTHAGTFRASSPGRSPRPLDGCHGASRRRTRGCRIAAPGHTSGKNKTASDIADTSQDAKSLRFPATKGDFGRFLDFLAKTGDTPACGGRSGSDSPEGSGGKTRAFDLFVVRVF